MEASERSVSSGRTSVGSRGDWLTSVGPRMLQPVPGGVGTHPRDVGDPTEKVATQKNLKKCGRNLEDYEVTCEKSF